MPRTNMGTVPTQFIEVRRLIKGYDGTAAELARALGCSYNAAADRLRHPENFTLGELKKIVIGLDVPADELRAAIKFN